MDRAGNAYDPNLIEELGVKLYLRGLEDLKTSNINFFIRGSEADKAWADCNFGCHGPSYRQLRRPSTFSEALAPIEDVSPVLAGFVDGLHSKTIGAATNVARGVERTAEGLHLTGGDNFQKVGEENYSAYQLVTTSFDKVVNFELNVIDNPLTQLIFAITEEYISILPNWVIIEASSQGALKFPDKVDTTWILKAAALGVINNISTDDLSSAATLLNNPAQKFVGKQLGKKATAAIASIIATYTTKVLITNSREAMSLKRRLVRLRKVSRSATGGLGGTLISLLKAQGLLGHAAQASRDLQTSCPRLWKHFRYKLHGADMLYFLVRNITEEYIDRLALLEKNPDQFISVMRALIKSKNTPDIFFPRAH